MGFYATTFENETAAIFPRVSRNAYPRQNSVTSGLRYYNSAFGRWLSRDPIGEKGGKNNYAFVENKGVAAWDYLGFAGFDPVEGAKAEKECSQVLKQYLENNKEKEWLKKFTFLTEDPGDWDEEGFRNPNWSDEFYKKNKGQCRVWWYCTCTCPDGKGLCKSRTGTRILKWQEKTGKDWRGGDVFKDFVMESTVKESRIKICSQKTGNKYKWEHAFTHELQHAKDHCDGGGKVDDSLCKNKYPGDTPNDSANRKACECAASLCSEIRAHQHNYKGFSPVQIFDKIKKDYLPLKPDCENASPDRVRSEISICDVTTGMILDKDVIYSTTSDINDP